MQIPTLPGLDLPPVPAVSPMELARRERDRIASDLEKRAGDTFRAKAAAFIERYLDQHGPTAGEVLVNECKDAGLRPPLQMDDRAFGPVFLRLAHRKVIRVCGQVPRLKGHLTGGGNVWERVR